MKSNNITMKVRNLFWKRANLMFLALLLGCVSLLAQSLQISGTVKLPDGDPVIGGSVRVKGSMNATITDVNGKFQISVPSKSSVLVFSYVGSVTQEVVADKDVINVTLQESATTKLDEVVVVGYGVQKKANLTGSVSSMHIDDVKDIPASNTSSLLQGRMAGVTVSSFTSQPGKDDDVEIRIRGLGTFGNNNPMIIVDGVEGTLGNIAPNDIENISVLKDAASASIYGVRAANGVILITTKRGAVGTTKLSYSGTYGIQQATVLPKYVNSWQWATLFNEQNNALGASDNNYTPDMLKKLENGSDPDHFANTDWSKALFRSAPIQNHYLSMTGGSNNSNYMASVGYMNQDGIMMGTSSNRVNFRLNADTKYLNNMLSLGVNLAGNHQEVVEPSIGTYNVFEYLNWHSRPSVPVKYANGEWGYFDGNPKLQQIKNPIHATTVPKNTTLNRFDGNIHADLEPIKNLHLRSSFAYQYDSWTDKAFAPTYTTTTADGLPAGLGTTINTLDQTYYFGTQWVNENTMTYSFKQEDHSLNVLLGQSAQYNGYKISTGHGEVFPSNTIQVLDAALRTSATGTAAEAALRSFFGRVNYIFKDRYMAEINLRRDETSRIPKKNRTGYFPSFSAGWNISEESFMKEIKAISVLKLRSSWGKLGNQDIGYYPFAQNIQIGYNYVWGDNIVPGTAITSLANPDIKWETTTTTNVGIDAAFLKNKISLTADYFVKNTDDILLQLPIPDMVGVDNPPYVNAAKVRNKGWEIDLGYNDKWNDWSFGTRFNLSKVNNEVVDLKGKQSWIQGWSINLEGYPINAYYGYVADGLYRKQAEVDKANENNQIGGGNLKVGDIRLKDISGPDGKPDGVIDTYDRTVIGNPFPKITYAMNFTAGYKRFDFAAFFQGIGKVDRIIMDFPKISGNVTTAMWDRYSPTENPNGAYPRLGNGDYNSQPSSFWIKDASYLRLKNLELGYTLPTQLIGKARLQYVRVFFSAQNLLTFTKIKNYDPEKYTTDTRGYAYPNAKTYSIGLNITL